MSIDLRFGISSVRHESGFTIVEMSVTALLAIILFSSVWFVIGFSRHIFLDRIDCSLLLSETQRLSFRLADDLRQTRSVTAADKNGVVRFVLHRDDGTLVTYALVDDSLKRDNLTAIRHVVQRFSIAKDQGTIPGVWEFGFTVANDDEQSGIEVSSRTRNRSRPLWVPYQPSEPGK